MDARFAELDAVAPLAGLVGYLNYADGRPDPRWQRQINDAFRFFAERGAEKPWQSLLEALTAALPSLQASGAAAFRDVSQARAVLDFARQFLIDYRTFHSDLLSHLPDADLFQPFFLARVLEFSIQCHLANEDNARTVVLQFSDFVGYRPLAVLETRPHEPYDHERTRPVPVYLREVGVGHGRYHDIVAEAVRILHATDANLLAEAQLDLELLDELAIDVRAFDHGHPANRRPNYVFGEWDPHHLDHQGRYRRYVIRQITLDGLLARVDADGPPDRAQRLVESAAVLAGTILMATGFMGRSPTSHDSSMSLSALLPRIARSRDAFYEQLLPKLSVAHAERLREEQQRMRQPFGAARQFVNNWIARHRARQLQQRHLGVLFAQMGYPEASRAEARRIPSVAARFQSEILICLSSGSLELERGELARAADRLPQFKDLIHRGIHCGAFCDPWNIVGYQALFPLSPAREDAVRDGRADELVELVESALNLFTQLISEAAASGEEAVVESVRRQTSGLAAWWDRYATVAVSDIRHVEAHEALGSAMDVAAALAEWRRRGAAEADLAFWRNHLQRFIAPKAYALIVDALLRKGDFRAAMFLLISWLGQFDRVPLEDGADSFPNLALRWILALTQPAEGEPDRTPLAMATGDKQAVVVKFFDYLEANAEEYWEVPTLNETEPIGMPEEADEPDNPYEAAYEGMTYQDSNDEGGGAVLGDPEEEEEPYDLEYDGPRIEKRLRFLSTLARLWHVAARFLADGNGTHDDHLIAWRNAARGKRRQLEALVDAIHDFPLPEPSGEYDSIVEYDRRRVVKEQLTHAAISTCLDMALAAGALQGAISAVASESSIGPGTPPWEPQALRLEQTLLAGDADATRALLPPFLERFRSEPMLFSPLHEGGSPRQILRVRLAQAVLRGLLSNLPRLGLLRETHDLLRAAREMEQNSSPSGRRGVTEFNHFFQSAFQAVCEAVVTSALDWPEEQSGEQPLTDLMERLTAPFLALWVEHSRSLQLSVLETVGSDEQWAALKQFIQRYGADLFHARFMTPANLRGILHRGVGAYLDALVEEPPDPLRPIRLVEELDRIDRPAAERWFEVTLQAVIENYEEYKDYNTTTSQSDYGQNLHVLLDFLRLKALYERQAWQFRPLVMAHEVLARAGRNRAAIRWQQQMASLTKAWAEQHQQHLASLERSHGVRLSTIRDRIDEAFLRPLAVDRLCALVEPALVQARQPGARPAFDRLQEELRPFTESPTGVGLDVPDWLARLESEVQRVQARNARVVLLAETSFRVPRRTMNYEDVKQQISDWERPALPE